MNDVHVESDAKNHVYSRTSIGSTENRKLVIELEEADEIIFATEIRFDPSGETERDVLALTYAEAEWLENMLRRIRTRNKVRPSHLKVVR